MLVVAVWEPVEPLVAPPLAGVGGGARPGGQGGRGRGALRRGARAVPGGGVEGVLGGRAGRGGAPLLTHTPLLRTLPLLLPLRAPVLEPDLEIKNK